MKPAPFAYHRPASVEEAVELLAATGGKVLAGGQSLVPIMSMRLAAPTDLVDINGLSDLDTVTVDAGRVRVGALARHTTVEHHREAYAANPLLRRALQHVAHPTIRNRGTTVGSLVHADPAAEMPAVLCLLGGQVEALGPDGPRTIPSAEFFAGPLESSLADDELAVAAIFPNPAAGSGTAWVEIARRHGDYGLVGVGAVVAVAAGVVAAASVALISVGPVPVVVDVTPAVHGIHLSAADWSQAAALVDAVIEPEADLHASAEYRRHLAGVLVGQALRRAADDAVSEDAA